MLKHLINEFLQSKNIVMFITSIMFILGTFSFFTGYGVIFCSIISVIAIMLIVFNVITPKNILLLIFIYYIGFLNCSLRIKATDELFQLAPHADFKITGQIVSIPDNKTNNRVSFFFKTDKGKTLVFISDNTHDFKVGNYYQLTGKLRLPFKASNPSQFDYAKYLKNFNTYTVLYVKDKDIVKHDKDLTFKWKFYQYLNDKRNSILKTHEKYLKSPNIEILGGIVFGDDAVTPPDYVKTTFINSGLLHILAASGMNVAFIYGFWFFFMFTVFKFPFKFTVITGMGVVVLYTLMTGLGASVIRAAIMLLFILAGKLIDRDTHSIALLSLVAVLMLLYNPAFINDVGFQLSFIATFGLLVSSDILTTNAKGIKRKLIVSAKDTFLIPVIAQLWVAPLQMFYFNTFCLYSVLANIITVIFLPFISFGGFVSSILSLSEFLADYVCRIFDFFLNPFVTGLVAVSDFFAGLPNSLITTTHPSVVQILIYYTILLLMTLYITKKSNNFLYSSAILLLVLLLTTINIPNKNCEILTFSLNNADSFLIKTPKNKYFIIDTGKSGYNGGKSQAEFIIKKYLNDKGIKNIEGMILTHFDNDHSGGAVDLYKGLKIKNTYVNNFSDKSLTSKRIFEEIHPLSLAQNNAVIYSEPNFELRTFHITIPNNDNESSVLTCLRYKDFSMLFMGDGGIIEYNKLKNVLPKNISVLKLGHHGAKNTIDKSMLEILNPQYVIISNAPNDYNHPHALTLNTLRKRKVLMTSEYNAIKLSVQKDKFNIYVFDDYDKKFKLCKN